MKKILIPSIVLAISGSAMAINKIDNNVLLNQFDLSNSTMVQLEGSINIAPVTGGVYGYYNITAELKGYDPTKHSLRWEIQNQDVGENIPTLRNIKLEDNTENKIEVFIIDKNGTDVTGMAH